MAWLLKSAGAAVGKVLTRGGDTPCDLLDDGFQLKGSGVPWTFHKAKKRKGTSDVAGVSEACSAFVLDITKASPSEVDAARNAVKRLRTTRHPHIISYVDSVEPAPDAKTGKIVLVTEAVQPLEVAVTGVGRGSGQLPLTPSVVWGIHCLFRAIGFLNGTSKLCHGRVCMGSIFVDDAGDWKLGGFELVSDLSDTSCPFRIQTGLRLPKLLPPEVMREQWGALAQMPQAVDSWSLGCFIQELFRGPMFRPEDLRNTDGIPQGIMPLYQKLLSSSPSRRLLATDLVSASFFTEVPLVWVSLFFEELAVKDADAKEQFFNKLSNMLEADDGGLPEAAVFNKIVPELTRALEFGGSVSAVLRPLLRLGRRMRQDQFISQVVPSVIRCFAQPDRAVRIGLLQSLESFAEHLTPDLVEKEIWPHVEKGFSDTSPALRELTARSIVHLVPRMSSKTVTGPVLSRLGALQRDTEPAIRTNVAICLGMIAKHVTSAARASSVLPCLLHGCRDPFPPTRMACVSSLGALISEGEGMNADVLAQKALPAVGLLCVDQELEVRKRALATCRNIVDALEADSERPREDDVVRGPISVPTGGFSGTASKGNTTESKEQPPGAAAPSSGGSVTASTAFEDDGDSWGVGGDSWGLPENSSTNDDSWGGATEQAHTESWDSWGDSTSQSSASGKAANDRRSEQPWVMSGEPSSSSAAPQNPTGDDFFSQFEVPKGGNAASGAARSGGMQLGGVRTTSVSSSGMSLGGGKKKKGLGAVKLSGGSSGNGSSKWDDDWGSSNW